MTFEIYCEKIEGPQQTYITDWLQLWQPSTAHTNDSCDITLDDDYISPQ